MYVTRLHPPRHSPRRCHHLLRPSRVTDLRPPRGRVWLNLISSADGGSAIAGASGALGNRDDDAVFKALREQADAVLVGMSTAPSARRTARCHTTLDGSRRRPPRCRRTTTRITWSAAARTARLFRGCASSVPSGAGQSWGPSVGIEHDAVYGVCPPAGRYAHVLDWVVAEVTGGALAVAPVCVPAIEFSC